MTDNLLPQPRCILLKGQNIARISKTMGSSIAYAAYLELFPDNKIDGNPATWETMMAHPHTVRKFYGRVPKVFDYDNAVVLMRDPVERFRSQCADSKGWEVEQLLSDLEAGTGLAYHLDSMKAVKSFAATNVVFKFPEHMVEFLAHIGMDELPFVNESEREKPVLTPEQLARVEALFAEDIAIYNSITEAGQVIEKPEFVDWPLAELQPTAKEIEQAQRQAAYDIAAAAFNAMPLGKQAMWEPVRAAVATAILTGDMARAIEILQTTPATYPDAESDRNAFLALFV